MSSKVVDITAVKDSLQKQSKELKNAMHRASQLGAAAAQKNGRSGGGKGGGGGKQSAETSDGTFLTGVPERQRQLPTIVELQVFASEDLQERLGENAIWLIFFSSFHVNLFYSHYPNMYLQHNKHHDEILFYIEYDMKPLR